MTMTLARPREVAEETTPLVQWNPHQAGVWVAYHGSAFAGMIEEHWHCGFTATTRLGRQLGQFPSLDRAKAAMESHIHREFTARTTQ